MFACSSETLQHIRKFQRYLKGHTQGNASDYLNQLPNLSIRLCFNMAQLNDDKCVNMQLFNKCPLYQQMSSCSFSDVHNFYAFSDFKGQFKHDSFCMLFVGFNFIRSGQNLSFQSDGFVPHSEQTLQNLFSKISLNSLNRQNTLILIILEISGQYNGRMIEKS